MGRRGTEDFVMKLYFFPVAPNPTRVLLYLSLKEAGGAKIPLERVQINPRGEQNSAEHLARNPFGRLPVLELDDGTHLTESRAIIGYLEERFPEPDLIGATSEERAHVAEMERIAELGVLYPIARIVHATKSPFGLTPNPPVAEFYQPRLTKTLEVLEHWMGDGRSFIAGNRPTIADCTMQAGLQFGRLAGVQLEASFERLTTWDRSFRERAEVAEMLFT
jgi:glutathione S-transferase